MELPSPDTRQLVAACLREKITAVPEMEAFLRSKGVTEVVLPAVVKEILQISSARKTAKKRITEGSGISLIGIAGISYSFFTKVDGAVWLLWTAVGVGLLGNGLFIRNKIKKYH